MIIYMIFEFQFLKGDLDIILLVIYLIVYHQVARHMNAPKWYIVSYLKMIIMELEPVESLQDLFLKLHVPPIPLTHLH